MPLPDPLPRYDRKRTYRWNFDHAPDPVDVAIPEVPGRWTFCGLPVASPLGMPAGPLLNGRWILYYASLGFDVLTYKTVRSTARECYPLPNLQPVETGLMSGSEADLPLSDRMQGSWAVSFGMPSMSPDYWRADVERTRKQLARGKLLSVSVVGTVPTGGSLDELAADYARCARWAVESGADCIETNFSCPNVATQDGQLDQQPDAARIVAERVRDSIGGDCPFLLKIGHTSHPEQAEALLEALGPLVDGLAMTNSVATRVRDRDGTLLFGGQRRGICGEATRSASVEQVRLFSRLIDNKDLRLSLVGVGGASGAEHVRQYLDAGAEAVHIATAAMLDPLVACRIRRDLASPGSDP